MQSKVGHIPHFGPHVINQLITWELYLWSLCSALVCAWLKSLVFHQIIWRTFQKTRRIIRTHKVNPSDQTLDIIVCNVCHKNETFNFSSSPKTAALSIVKEVANHANDIMKQGVRLGHHSKSRAWYHQCLSGLTLVGFVFFQDNFQKLMQIQYSLNGHHEIVQPGRVSSGGSTEHRKCFINNGFDLKKTNKTVCLHRCSWRRALWWSCPGRSCSHACSFWLDFHRNEITFFSVFSPEVWRLSCVFLFLGFVQFNDALMYTTPVQSAQYKLNCVLSLAGMKVGEESSLLFVT